MVLTMGSTLMTRLSIPEPKQLCESREILEQVDQFVGYVPNDYLVMAHEPELLKGVIQLTMTVLYGLDPLPDDVKRLVPYMASRSAGCRYCSAHAAKFCTQAQVDSAKVQNIRDYATSPLFTEAERAALCLAEKANSAIDEITDEDFARLRQHFGPRQIVQIVGLIALMGFYNKWNATMATALETPWLELAARNMTEG